MANKWRGEVEFPALGEGAYVSFPLEDLAELENRFGEDFFGVIEAGLRPADGLGRVSPNVAMPVLAIGMKRRDGDAISRIWDDEGRAALKSEQFRLADTVKPILDAIAISWLQKSYDELVAEAVVRQKQQDADTLKRAKEAAEAAGVPFTEALLEGLLKLLIAPGSALSRSGN